jgi:hypothetical protein
MVIMRGRWVLSNLNGWEKVKGGMDQVRGNNVKMRKETRNKHEGLIIKAGETGENIQYGYKNREMDFCCQLWTLYDRAQLGLDQNLFWKTSIEVGWGGG